jgi:carbon storage regulator
MLVLTRAAGESIQIGDNITVHIKLVYGQRVRVLVDAPKDVRIRRTEIIDRYTHTTENEPE